MRFGTTAFIQRPTHMRLGWEIQLVRYEGLKVFRADPTSIQWIEVSEHTTLPNAINVREIEDLESVNRDSKLAGENEALKNEVNYLRGEITKLLEKVIK